MKKFISSAKFIAALCMAVGSTLFYASCSSDGSSESEPSSSSVGNGLSVEKEQVYDSKTEKQYTGNGKIYMAEKRNPNNGQPILEDSIMVEIGTVSNGKISFVLPEDIDSSFLTKVDSEPGEGLTVEPLGTEMWFYTDPFWLLSNGELIGDLWYGKVEGDFFHAIYYWYFSNDTKVNGILTDVDNIEYKVDAKKGWNNIYIKSNYNDETSYVTTDLSEVPNGLKWWFIQ